MRSQVIDMVGYAGDISTAKERLGIGSALIMVKGGTSGTAIKVVTCSTSNGEFTDYVTLEAEGSSDLIKGYYVDLNGADKYIKVTGAKFADVVFGDCNFDPKGIVASGTVPVIANLEDNKSATINASTYTAPVEITPIAGKDGMKKATVTVTNIPEPSDIEAEKEVSVNVTEYTEPIQIVPTEGKDGMAKVILTLTGL